MIKKALLLLALAINSASFGAIPKNLLPSAKEATAMLNEADDFIDDLPDGFQDHQSDAVYHALHGMYNELNEVRNSRNKSLDPSDNVEVTDLKGEGAARGIPMRLYSPKQKSSKPLPLLVYFHGGGWTFGSLNSCAAFCDAVAASGQVIVLAVDYSLAPENPFPAAIDDCVAATEYAFAKASEWGSSPKFISLGGDSSGGNLALATMLALDDNTQFENRVKSLLLFYPVVKAYKDGSASWKEYSRGYGLDGRLMEAFNEAYLSGTQAGEAAAKNPRVSPAEADDEKLAKLPPVLIINAERDILCDQGKEFAERMKKLNHNTERIEFPGAIHLFITVPGQPTAFRKAVDITTQFLKQ